MGRKGITINLKATSPEGEVKTFKSIPEAAKELDSVNLVLEKLIMQKKVG